MAAAAESELSQRVDLLKAQQLASLQELRVRIEEVAGQGLATEMRLVKEVHELRLLLENQPPNSPTTVDVQTIARAAAATAAFTARQTVKPKSLVSGDDKDLKLELSNMVKREAQEEQRKAAEVVEALRERVGNLEAVVDSLLREQCEKQRQQQQMGESLAMTCSAVCVQTLASTGSASTPPAPSSAGACGPGSPEQYPPPSVAGSTAPEGAGSCGVPVYPQPAPVPVLPATMPSPCPSQGSTARAGMRAVVPLNHSGSLARLPERLQPKAVAPGPVPVRRSLPVQSRGNQSPSPSLEGFRPTPSKGSTAGGSFVVPPPVAGRWTRPQPWMHGAAERATLHGENRPGSIPTSTRSLSPRVCSSPGRPRIVVEGGPVPLTSPPGSASSPPFRETTWPIPGQGATMEDKVAGDKAAGFASQRAVTSRGSTPAKAVANH